MFEPDPILSNSNLLTKPSTWIVAKTPSSYPPFHEKQLSMTGVCVRLRTGVRIRTGRSLAEPAIARS